MQYKADLFLICINMGVVPFPIKKTGAAATHLGAEKQMSDKHWIHQLGNITAWIRQGINENNYWNIKLEFIYNLANFKNLSSMIFIYQSVIIHKTH